MAEETVQGSEPPRHPSNDIPYELLNQLVDQTVMGLTGEKAWPANWRELRMELDHVMASAPWDELKVLVSRNALVTLLNALNGPGHHIREIQATRSLPMGLGEENPISKLTRQIQEQDLRHVHERKENSLPPSR